MDPLGIQPFLDWVAANHRWAVIAVFLIAMSESLAVVGLIMPGALLMFGVGALIAGGALSFWPVAVSAVLGAIAGDGLSYWLGRHYRVRLRTLWPFRRHPKLISRGVDFFHRHGAKSVVLGRFVGPLRPILPAVAGMLEMPPLRFMTINILSALAWAPAYLLPGMAVGASLSLASEVAGRLVLLLLLLLALLWTAGWLLASLSRLSVPHTDFLVHRALLWSSQHRLLGRLPSAILDPTHPEVRALTTLAILLFLSGIGLLTFTQFPSIAQLLGGLDKLVSNAMRDLRSPWADQALTFIAGFAQAKLLVVLVALVAAQLVRERRWRVLSYWLSAALVPGVITAALDVAGRQAEPTDLPEPGTIGPLAPLESATGMAVFGFLAVLLAREFPLRSHAYIYAAAGMLLLTLGLSRLYLGAELLSDMLGGYALGLVWVSLVGIAYRRHMLDTAPVRVAPIGLVAVLLVALPGVNVLMIYPHNLQSFALRTPSEELALESWWEGGWRRLPAWRKDLRDRRAQALSIQWAAPLEAIRYDLMEAGWVEPPPLGVGVTQWLRRDAEVSELPILPQVHDGLHEALALTRPSANTADLVALRLWRSGLRLSGGEQVVDLWIGNLSYLRLENPLGLSLLLSVPGQTPSPTPHLSKLQRSRWLTRIHERSMHGGHAAPVMTIRRALGQ